MFIRDEFGNLVFVPRTMCFADGEGEGAGGGSEGDAGAAAVGAGDGEGADGAKAAGEGKAAAGGAEGEGEGTSWRDSLPDDLKKHAERFNSVEDLVKANVESRQKLSKAIVPPGKDAGEDDVAAYRKLIGVPQKADGYKFEMPEGAEPSEGDKAFHGAMAETFHAANISKEQAAILNKAWNDYSAAVQQEQVAADKKYAEESDAALRKSWGGDCDKNFAHAERAAAWAFGDEFEELRALEGKDGRFLMDHPAMLKALASIGREMQEGGMAPPLSADAAEQAEEQLRDLRKKQAEAKQAGDSKRANKLYQDEMALIAKVKGNRPIVGTAGRAA